MPTESSTSGTLCHTIIFPTFQTTQAAFQRNFFHYYVKSFYASSLSFLAASTIFLRLASDSFIPLVFNPQSGFTHNFSRLILVSITFSANTISSTDGTLVQKFLNKWTIFLFCSILFSSNQKEH